MDFFKYTLIKPARSVCNQINPFIFFSIFVFRIRPIFKMCLFKLLRISIKLLIVETNKCIQLKSMIMVKISLTCCKCKRLNDDNVNRLFCI